MMVKIYLFVFFTTVFFIKNSVANEKIDTPISPNDRPVLMTFENQGWYIAEYELSYVSAGSVISEASGPVALGQSVSFLIPKDATNGFIAGQLLTGVAWDPTRKIFELPLIHEYVLWMLPDGSLDEVLLVTSGTVFNPSYNFQQPPGTVPIPK